MAILNFGGVEEQVITREEFTLEKAREVLKDETMQIEINPVLAMLLKRSEIEEELLKMLLESTSIDCSSVIKEYEDWFIEEIKKGVQE